MALYPQKSKKKPPTYKNKSEGGCGENKRE
jgi:hypothetical protein